MTTKPDDRREARERLAKWWCEGDPEHRRLGVYRRWNPFMSRKSADLLLEEIERQQLQEDCLAAFAHANEPTPVNKTPEEEHLAHEDRWEWRLLRATPAQISEAVLAVIDATDK